LSQKISRRDCGGAALDSATLPSSYTLTQLRRALRTCVHSSRGAEQPEKLRTNIVQSGRSVSLRARTSLTTIIPDHIGRMPPPVASRTSHRVVCTKGAGKSRTQRERTTIASGATFSSGFLGSNFTREFQKSREEIGIGVDRLNSLHVEERDLSRCSQVHLL
jgi:hypothetical protein